MVLSTFKLQLSVYATKRNTVLASTVPKCFHKLPQGRQRAGAWRRQFPVPLEKGGKGGGAAFS